MPNVTTLIVNAIRAGASPKVVEFLGDRYERIMDMDRNLISKALKPEVVKAELDKIEAELKRVKLYKQDVPFTIRERLLACRLVLEKAFKQLAAPRSKRSA